MSAGLDSIMFKYMPPALYQSDPVRVSSKQDTPSGVTKAKKSSPPHSLEPAIDGPPSPERIRAYTEQMKRSSIFGNNSRSNTLSSSSASSSFVSRDLTSASSDGLTLSRKSSGRSTASNMPPQAERPESTLLFGSIFSRGGRKSRRNNSSASLAVDGGILEEGSARDHYYGKGHSSRKGASVSSVTLNQESQRRQYISGPYNFQHVTHTAQEQLPNLERSSRLELVSEFSALRASQAPTHGELKGIRAQDLHFENFSSETLSSPLPEAEDQSSPPPIPLRQRGVLHKSVQAPRAQRSMSYTTQHDRLGIAPPRPPRSPLSPLCPLELPERTSSKSSTRISSVLFDTFDPLAKPNVERTYRKTTSFRHPSFAPPRPSPAPLLLNQQQEKFIPNGLASHALTTPGNEAWPLTASPSGNHGFELADVKEEEEVGSRRSRLSVANSELRLSQSVPSLRRSYEAHNQSGDRVSVILSLAPLEGKAARSPLSPGFRFDDDSWEKDIDYCYEHEIEADCDYQWDQCSAAEGAPAKSPTKEVKPEASESHLEVPVEDDDRSIYHGRFRPSLLIPSAYDVPELSSMSNNSAISPDPRTPQIHLSRPSHARSSSHASSFKESHGFTLSPTLLIPSDFQSQMEQDAAYDDHFSNNQSISATIFEPEPYNACVSPVDESSSSIVSYRSSELSHGSTRSSSGTRISGTNSRGSQDSMVLLGRATSTNKAHQSSGSASSLPDLIPSEARKPENIPKKEEVDTNATTLSSAEDIAAEDSSTPTPPLRQQRSGSPIPDLKARRGLSSFVPPPLPIAPKVANEEEAPVSSVGELFPSMPREQVVGTQAHGRKVSAPVVSQSVKEFRTRPRAGTSSSGANLTGSKKRGSYMLFPQI